MGLNSPYKGKFKVTQVYKGDKHKGIDLVGITSKDIFSTVNGIVESARRDINRNDPNDTKYGMGNYIRIRDDETGYVFYFAHLSKILVKQGQAVRKGDLIGIEGSTGHSTGSHLHYEVRKIPDNSTFLDISTYIGIPNALGEYDQNQVPKKDNPKVAEAKKLVKEKTGVSQDTIAFLETYKYADSLFLKLADAMR